MRKIELLDVAGVLFFMFYAMAIVPILVTVIASLMNNMFYALVARTLLGLTLLFFVFCLIVLMVEEYIDEWRWREKFY